LSKNTLIRRNLSAGAAFVRSAKSNLEEGGRMLPELSILKPDLPYALQVEITSSCNLKCKMCPLTTERTPSSITPGHMQEVLWHEIVPMAREVGQVMIAGFGEPLVNRNCIPLLKELDQHNVWMSIVTNGTALTPTIAGELAAIPNLIHINVSIDSPDPAVYYAIRGGDLTKALNGLRNLMACIDNPNRVTVSSVVMASNMATLPSFPPILAELGVNRYILQGLINYNPESGAESVIGFSDGVHHLDQLRAACRDAGVELVYTLADRLDSEIRGDPQTISAYYQHDVGPAEQTKVCNLAWEIPYIDKDGKVYPCCYAASQSAEILGDLHSERLEEIWLGQRYQQFRADILDGRTTPEVCRGCIAVPLGQHPFRLYAARLLPDKSLLHGTTGLRLAVENIGARTWTQADMIRIGTANPRDHASAVESADWLSFNRVTSFAEEHVPPGGIATFHFSAQPVDGVAFDMFQLLAEGRCWIPNTRFKVTLDDGY
jgi:radical SAM protein with 4Fe4S-binding SPASM domain